MADRLHNRSIADGKYRLLHKIGNGSFGTIYFGQDAGSGEHVAVKVEATAARIPQLLYESKIYTRLLRGLEYFPKVKHFCTEGDNNYLVMDLLGPSLEELFNLCSQKFSLKTVLMLFNQMILRLEALHSKYFIHRDIKPDNFLMGMNKQAHIVHLIDFGLAQKYRSFSTRAHIEMTEKHSLTGTARYASTNSHRGVQQSRRDDLESLGYVLVYFMKGRLPWQGIKANTKVQKYERMCELKLSTPLNVLCENLPSQFEKYMNYCKTVMFKEKPDYLYVRQLFRELFQSQKFKNDYKYDWTELLLKRDGENWTAVKKDEVERKGRTVF